MIGAVLQCALLFFCSCAISTKFDALNTNSNFFYVNRIKIEFLFQIKHQIQYDESNSAVINIRLITRIDVLSQFFLRVFPTKNLDFPISLCSFFYNDFD